MKSKDIWIRIPMLILPITNSMLLAFWKEGIYYLRPVLFAGSLLMAFYVLGIRLYPVIRKKREEVTSKREREDALEEEEVQRYLDGLTTASLAAKIETEEALEELQKKAEHEKFEFLVSVVMEAIRRTKQGE